MLDKIKNLHECICLMLINNAPAKQGVVVDKLAKHAHSEGAIEPKSVAALWFGVVFSRKSDASSFKQPLRRHGCFLSMSGTSFMVQLDFTEFTGIAVVLQIGR